MNTRTASALVAIALLLAPAAGAHTPVKDWPVWTDAQSRYTISYPPGWTVDAGYTFQGLGPTSPPRGVLFQIPRARAAGTNLSANGTGVGVIVLPEASQCSVSSLIATTRIAHTLSENGRRWSIGKSSDAGAGNIYTTRVYLLRGKPCIAVLYLIHSTQFGNYPAGTIRRFHVHELMAMFDRVRRSLKPGKPRSGPQ